MKNTPTGFQTVIEHFKRNRWNFQLDPNRPMLHAGFRGRNGTFRCIAAVDESDDLVQVFSFVPVVVPPAKLTAVAELCVRLSYPMKMGHFALDLSDGELRFHTSSAYPKGELKDEVVQRVLGVNLAMVDQHFPALIRVIHGFVGSEKVPSQANPLISKETAPEPAVHPPGRISFN